MSSRRKELKFNPSALKKITIMKAPETPAEMRSWLGMVQFIGRFLTDYVTISAPPRRLTKMTEPWRWDIAEQQAFVAIKRGLCKHDWRGSVCGCSLIGIRLIT